MATDRFGHPVDGRVGYAWGDVLASYEDEARRMLAGRALIRDHVARHGAQAVSNLAAVSRADDRPAAVLCHRVSQVLAAHPRPLHRLPEA